METIDISHAFLPVTVAKLSTLTNSLVRWPTIAAFVLWLIDAESQVTFTQTDRQFKYRYNSEREGIYSLQFSYDASVLAVGYGDGTIEVTKTINHSIYCVLHLYSKQWCFN